MNQDETTVLRSRVIKTEMLNWRTFQFIQPENFKDLSKDAKQKLKDSILKNDFTQPFYVWYDESGGVTFCLDGYHRVHTLLDLEKAGHPVPLLLPATFIECETKQAAAKLVLTYSSIYANVTETGLLDFLQMYDLDYMSMKDTIDLPGFDELEFESMRNINAGTADASEKKSLIEDFIIPPFSILDSRQGYWIERKRMWEGLLPDSQATREDVELFADSAQNTEVYNLRNKIRAAIGRDPSWDEILKEAEKKGLHVNKGASIFDPVLTEIAYRWFNLPGGITLDPFAGGSVRGLIASILGYPYYGIDLRKEQVEENRRHAENLGSVKPTWYKGDSNVVLDEMKCDFADFVFSCPPYHDLEQYSDDPADLSNMSYEQFIEIYSSIISKSVSKLKVNRFACFVVSEIRDKKGWCKGFVRDTIAAFERAGAMLYNDAILINQIGSGAIRSRRMFQAGRKLCKVHQNVLVFYKGDLRQIPKEFPAIALLEESEQHGGEYDHSTPLQEFSEKLEEQSLRLPQGVETL